MAKYAPIEERGWQPLPELLMKKKAIISIKNDDDRCLGYALLYFIKREILLKKPNDFDRVFKKKKCLSATISKLSHTQSHTMMSIITKISFKWTLMCFFIKYEGCASHPILISRKNHKRVANLLYWKNHFAPILNISRMFSDLTKGNRVH